MDGSRKSKDVQRVNKIHGQEIDCVCERQIYTQKDIEIQRKREREREREKGREIDRDLDDSGEYIENWIILNQKLQLGDISRMKITIS